MNPSLRMTRELIDQIVFGMENQERDYVLDTIEATVIPAAQVPPEENGGRYILVPEWRSVDGYNLMEQFVATLHNPIYRSRLRSILASGRGVFRQFKDTIRERREIERLWFTFKERAMRDLVVEWYNDLREQDGLERLESTIVETETETDQLVASDFGLRTPTGEDLERVRALDREAFDEVYPDTDPAIVDAIYEHHRAGVPAPSDPRSTVLVMETQGGDFAGFVWSVSGRSGDAVVAFVQQMYVLPEFRGFGLARRMFAVFCRRVHSERVGEVHLPLHGSTLDLEPNFLNYGMHRASATLRLDVDRWHRSEIG